MHFQASCVFQPAPLQVPFILPQNHHDSNLLACTEKYNSSICVLTGLTPFLVSWISSLTIDHCPFRRRGFTTLELCRTASLSLGTSFQIWPLTVNFIRNYYFITTLSRKRLSTNQSRTTNTNWSLLGKKVVSAEISKIIKTLTFLQLFRHLRPFHPKSFNRWHTHHFIKSNI